MNTRDLLEQDEVWLTADRMPIQLADMDSGHRFNTLAFLRRRAAYLAKAYVYCEERIFLSAPDDVYEQWVVERAQALVDGPEAWLERRPLVRELARLVALDGQPDVVDGEVVMTELSAGGGVLVRVPS